MILLVEDNVDLGRVYARALQGAGFPTRWVTTGAEGLALLRGTLPLPLVAIVDLALPDMDGVEFARRARVAGYAGPMVAMSGALDLMDGGKLEAADFVSRLRKPLVLSELVGCARRWARSEPFEGSEEVRDPNG